MTEPVSLQQIDRTFVRYRGRKLSYFSGCDYFRLASHPRIIAAMAHGAKSYGVTVAASRLTTGNHPIYGCLEERLARFFGVPMALLIGSGYLTNLAVAQGLAGNFSHALVDERAHASLQDAARFLECPVLQFKHRNVEDLYHCVNRCGPGAGIIVLTDGLFAHDGSVAPLNDYLKALPCDAVILVDDAHGAGILGKTGKGSPEHIGVSRQRVIQTITLSKAFGTYGGAILGSKSLRHSILTRSAVCTGSTPIPLPLANAVMTALSLLESDKNLRQRLRDNAACIKTGFKRLGLDLPENPGPIIRLIPPNLRAAQRLSRILLRANIFPPEILYPRTTAQPYFRFVISSEHSSQQLELLQSAVAKAGLAGWRAMG